MQLPKNIKLHVCGELCYTEGLMVTWTSAVDAAVVFGL